MDEIEELEHDLKEFITQVEAGNAPNPAKLLKIEQDLEHLLLDEKIPIHVKENLQHALGELAGELSLEGLYGAKREIDQARDGSL